MSVFDLHRFAAVTQGAWARPPRAGAELVGAGTDTREDLTGRAFFAIQGERFDGHDFLDQAIESGAALLVVDRSIDLPPGSAPVLRVDDVRRAMARLATAHRDDLHGTVIAITGSAGKTTTKRLVHSVLSQSLCGTASPRSFNNDIGVPLSLLAARPDDAYVVLEIGSNAPGEVAQLAAVVRPDIAAITSIGHCHLEGLGGIEGVIREKASLLDRLSSDGLAILPDDVEWPGDLVPLALRVERFGDGADSAWRLTRRDQHEAVQTIEINGGRLFDLRLPGAHNAGNALPAIAVGRAMGIGWDEIRHGLALVGPDAMRLNPRMISGIRVFDDCYNANPESVTAGLDTFIEMTPDAAGRTVVLGDMLELGAASARWHAAIGERLRDLIQRSLIGTVILIGTETLATHRAAGGQDSRITHFSALDETTIALICEMLRSADSVYIKGSRGMRLERIIDAMQRRAVPLMSNA